ncbi:MAG: RodZ domain-containing protein [Nitrospirota bacterium]
MVTLGKFLREARETRGIDLRDAAQQTRISIAYLKALENEDFSKLPGEVFVRGFLKNYGKFLNLNESEVLRKYAELKPLQALATAAPASPDEEIPDVQEEKPRKKILIEPFLWAAGIVLALVLFFLTALPSRQARMTPPGTASQTGQTNTQNKQEKLFLEVIALNDTWLLLRIDTSPQKKIVLKKGDRLIWSADERFQLSYGSSTALSLMINGKELIVSEPKNTVVRDLTVTASGIVQKKNPSAYAKPKRPFVPGVITNQSPTTPQPGTLKPLEQQRSNQPPRVQGSVPQQSIVTSRPSISYPDRQQKPIR